MMSEANQRRVVNNLLKEVRADPHNVENAISRSMPDLNCIYGWVELKVLSDWPARTTTPVRLAHPKRVREQVTWLNRRWKAGGGAWLLLTVDRDWLLFTAPIAFKVWGPAEQLQTKDDLRTLAFCSWSGYPTGAQLATALSQSQPQKDPS